MESFLPFLKMFATPLGSIVNKTLAGAGASAVTWAVTQGVSAESATAISGAVLFGVSTLISGLAATQGVKIAVINDDDANGVKVVHDEVPAPAVNSTRR